MSDQEEKAKTSEEYDEDAIYRNPAFEKWEYEKIFVPSTGYVGSSTRGSFYTLALKSAELIVKRIDEGLPQMDYEGTAALYLFRHYLELSLKKIVMGARFLNSKDKNATEESVTKVGKFHDLMNLWLEVKNNIPKKLGGKVWKQWDHSFVEQCIEEFHNLDPDGERLRYKRIHDNDNIDPSPPVLVNWNVFLRGIKHTYDVLEDIDTYLIETYGLNADWEAEQNSW